MEGATNQDSRARLLARLHRIRARMAAALARAARPPGSAELLAVVKQLPDATVEAAIELGLVDLAENRVQSLLARHAVLGGRARLHLIGPLQSNKVQKAVAHAAELHSVDRPELVALLARAASAVGRVLPVWIQVNVAEEPQKHGCAPHAAAALAQLTSAAASLTVRGLMTIAPLTSDAETVRPVFRALRNLAAQLQHDGALPTTATGLCMGMSSDFEVAIEEGATVVRIGSALFQEEAAC